MLFLFAIFSFVKSISDEEVEALLQSLTLEEKVGQIAQIGIDRFVDIPTDTLIDEQATLGIVTKKIGSVLNTYNLQGHDRKVWANIQKSFETYIQKTDKKIPLVYGIDTIHGGTFILNSTLFPQEIGIAATFNTTIARIGSEVAAYETRSASIPWTFSPVVDLGLDARWARLWEDFGEDPYLSGQMGAAMTIGFQGGDGTVIDTNHVAACAKHYVGYGNPVSGKDRTPAVISENYLREYHLPSFKAVVDAGVASIMVNSGLINGIPVHSSKFLLTDILKGELGFKGLIVTDWDDTENIHRRDHVAATSKEAVKKAVNAGIDMAMIPESLSFVDDLIELVNEGEVKIERIDDAVRRVLQFKNKLGLFETRLTSPEDYPKAGTDEHAKIAYAAATESITLLKNDNNVLPLKKGVKVLVTGPNANSIRSLDGGWSYSWQGDAAPRFTDQYNTVVEAIRNVNGEGNVVYVPGVAYNESGKYYDELEAGIPDAVAAAAGVDYIILVVGENSYTEKPGDAHDLSLSPLQLKLGTELIKTGKPVILVLNEGRPRIIEKLVDGVVGIFQLYLPGNYGGDAFADILFGDVNPSGKLPYTYPRYRHSYVNYWHKYSEEQTAQPGAYNYESDYNPLYEFGYGLSYTTFDYSNLKLSRTSLGIQDSLTVSITVTNSGSRIGKEAVLVYLSDLYASIAPDKKRLRKFEKVELAPAESKTLDFALSYNDFSFININNQRVVETGQFNVTIGTQRATFTIE